MTRTDNENVKLPILKPLVLAIVTLLVVSIAGTYSLQTRNIDDQVWAQISEVNLLLRERIKEDSRRLQGFAAFVAKNEQLQRHWLAADRSALQRDAEPILDELRSEYGITHFYFHGLDHVCFLRVHNPDRHGDTIDRATLEGAVRSARPAWGIELRPMGTFTVRLVHPWWIDGKLAGYIELGEQFDHIVPALKNALGVELIVVIDKSFLDRSSWEEGMRMLGRKPEWDLSPHVVMINHTFGQAPVGLIARARPWGDGWEERLFRWTANGTPYRGGSCPLLDASRRRVGAIIVVNNIKDHKASVLSLCGVLVAVGAMTAAILLVGFHWFIRRIEGRLTSVYAALKAEIERRRETEQQLQAHQENLEDLVSKRTLELQTTNQQLAQEVAERVRTEEALDWLNRDLESAVHRLSVANRDLQDFLNVAAHDLKGPVRSMGTLADWILTDYGDNLDEQGQDYLDLLVKRARRLTSHVDRILEYAGVWSITRPREETDLNTLVNDVVADIAPPPSTLIVLDAELPTVVVDRIHMVQIFRGLLDNAVKYMDKPEGVIRVHGVEEGQLWKFSVSDNGPGIERKYFEKIFKMFQTLAPRDEVEATGVGLAIAKRIVELYDGKIWVESILGQGSTFFFTLSTQRLRAGISPIETLVMN